MEMQSASHSMNGVCATVSIDDNPKASQLHLPLELLYAVIRDLQHSDLLSVALVSRQLQYEAEKFLWRSIDWTSCPPYRVMKCCHILRKCPRRAWSVTDLKFVDLFKRSLKSLQDARIIFDTIASLPSLKHLHAEESLYSWLIDPKFPRINLVSFACVNPDEHVDSYLRNTPSIQHVRLMTTKWHSAWKPNLPGKPICYLPNLKSIGSYPELLEYYVPDRNVSTVDADFGADSGPLRSILSIANQSNVPVTSFTIKIHVFQAKAVQAIAQALPFLEELVLKYTPVEVSLRQVNIQDLLTGIGMLSNLNRLTIFGQPPLQKDVSCEDPLAVLNSLYPEIDTIEWKEPLSEIPTSCVRICSHCSISNVSDIRGWRIRHTHHYHHYRTSFLNVNTTREVDWDGILNYTEPSLVGTHTSMTDHLGLLEDTEIDEDEMERFEFSEVEGDPIDLEPVAGHLTNAIPP